MTPSPLVAALRNPALPNAYATLVKIAKVAHAAANLAPIDYQTATTGGPPNMGASTTANWPDKDSHDVQRLAMQFTARILQGWTIEACWDEFRATQAAYLAGYSFAPFYDHAAKTTPYLGTWDQQPPECRKPAEVFFATVVLLAGALDIEIPA